MSEEKTVSSVASEDRLWAALAYIFSPVVPIIALLMEDKKDNPYVRFHSVQALVWGVFLGLLISITIVGSFAIIGLCLIPLDIVAGFMSLYYAYKAYQGDDFKIPVITDLIHNQGWA